MSISNDKILNALRNVIDPDLKKDLVTLNMIDNIKIENKKVSFDVVLTTPACPLKDALKKACIKAINDLVSADLEVLPNMTSKVSTNKGSAEPILPKVKNIIAVASGKGGVGKSTVAANIAIALSKMGAKTGLLDADIYGPSAPIMFDLHNVKPNVRTEGENAIILPLEKYGIKILSIGFFVDPNTALAWRGPMAASALKQLITDADWGELDYLIIDLPPGTGDIHLTLVQSIPVTGAVIVSTPQNVALADVRKGVNLFQTGQVNVPILGLIENMAYFTPAELPENKYYIFGREGCRKMAEELTIPFLGQIPLIQSICESGDSGKPVAIEATNPASDAFMKITKNIAQQVALRNANIAPTKVVQMDQQQHHHHH